MNVDNKIKFGTDGWRSVIGDGFTFSNVERVTQATCDTLRGISKSKIIYIGYDHRFLSSNFAESAAHVALANGFKVEFSRQPITSPVLSHIVRKKKAAIGIMITASHNPSLFNGFKLKGPHGGSANENFTKKVENNLDGKILIDDRLNPHKNDFTSSYYKFLSSCIRNLNLLKGPFVFDAMHGPGGILLERWLGKSSQKIKFIRKERDPLFGGVNPEPIEKNLGALREAVLRTKAKAGLAVDGDGDRMGVIDDRGQYHAPHTIFPLLLLHLIENRKMKGKVVQTLSLGFLSQRIAQHFRLPFEVLSVGYKYIAQKMMKEKVIFGGEESGGYGVGLWSVERDGLLCSLLLLELLTIKNMPLSKLIEDLFGRFGSSVFERVDIPLDRVIDKQAWTTAILSAVGKKLAGVEIKSIRSDDGIKITRQDDAWLLLRPSGTELLIRTYAEASDRKSVQDLLSEAQQLLAKAARSRSHSNEKRSKKSKKKDKRPFED